MTTTASELQTKGAAAKRAARELARTSTAVKNAALNALAEALTGRASEVLRANQHDVQGSREAGLSDAVVDRLTLTSERIGAIAADVRNVALLADPVGEMIGDGTVLLLRHAPIIRPHASFDMHNGNVQLRRGDAAHDRVRVAKKDGRFGAKRVKHRIESRDHGS